jgi:hypothetical protein
MNGNINVSIELARKWWNSNDEDLKSLALEAYSRRELEHWPSTLHEALRTMYDNPCQGINTYNDIKRMDAKAGGMFLLNKVLQALHNKKTNSKQYFPKYVFVKHNVPIASVMGTTFAADNDVMYHGDVTMNGLEIYKVYSYISQAPFDIMKPLCGCDSYSQAIHLDQYFWQLILRTIYGQDIHFIECKEVWKD